MRTALATDEPDEPERRRYSYQVPGTSVATVLPLVSLTGFPSMTHSTSVISNAIIRYTVFMQ